MNPMERSTVRYDYWPRYGDGNYSLVMPFEQNFTSQPSTEWLIDYWHHSITISALYVFAILVGERWMKERKAYDLQTPLLLWNSALALFSIMGALRNVPELLWALRTQGFTYSICSASFSQGVSGFWTQAFAFSKVVELIDTAFIVARKRPLTFLHCYHHCTVMIYTWHAYKEHTASGRWFICMNYSVHALMYTYYALMTLKWFRIPKRFSMFVTLCQLAQMVMGVAIGVKVWRMSQLERATCQQTQDNLYLTFAIYFSYFLLFLNFFLQAYVRGRGGKSDTATSRVDATKAGVSNVLAKIRDEDRSFLSQPSNGTSSATANGDLHGSNHWHERNGGGLVRKENDRQSPPLTRLRRRQKEDVETEREPNHSG